jgi:hypothetical protein
MSHATEIVDITPARDMNNKLIPEIFSLSESNDSSQSDSAIHTEELGAVLTSKVFHRSIGCLANEIYLVAPGLEVDIANIPKSSNRCNIAVAIQNGHALTASFPD